MSRLGAGQLAVEPAISALVVDDEPVICEYMSDELTAMGLSVYCAHDVQSALQIALDSVTLDVAFVDLALPDRSGLELISELKRLRPGLPVVVATNWSAMASADRDGSERQLVLGKPYDHDSIANVLRELKIPIVA